MAALLFGLPGNEPMAERLAAILHSEVGTLSVRRFPDGESYLRLSSEVAGRDIALVCTLADPDAKLAQLLFAADLAREMGARRVGLVAPYLAYMRQDRRFQSGEAITSRTFARLLSRAFDWLATVDPHLHRYNSLAEIYSIPAAATHAAPLFGEWIKVHVHKPLIIGPDAESEQWVADVAARADAPHLTFSKWRLSDRDVRLRAPDLSLAHGRQPVLVDDIASTGRTLIEAANQLVRANFARPVCMVVHALFAEGAVNELRAVSSEIVSTDTVQHPTNQLAVAPGLASAIRELNKSGAPRRELERTVPDGIEGDER